MKDSEKTRAVLLAELDALRQRVALLERGDCAARLSQDGVARCLLAHSSEGIMLTDQTGCIVKWSAGLEQITGIPASEALGRQGWEVRYWLYPADAKDDELRDLLREESQQMLRDGVPLHDGAEFEIETPSGERRIVQQRMFVEQEPDGYCLGALLRDMTEVRNAVRALHESEGRYRTLFEQSPIPLWEEDFSQIKLYLDHLRASGVSDFAQYFDDHPGEVVHCTRMLRIMDVNQAALDLNQAVNKRDVMDLPYTRLVAEEMDLLRTQLIAIAEGQSSFSGEGWGHNLNGGIFKVSLRWVAVMGHERTLTQVILSMIDTTNEHLANGERDRLIRDLNAFAHTVAHDLKNPLGGITGYASLLANNLDHFDHADLHRYLTIIERDGHKMSSIIDELLVLSSVRSQSEIRLAPLDMLYVIANTISRLGFMIEEYNAEIVLPTGELPVALGYAAWIEEVWANYLSNAIKYGSKPPVVEIGGEASGDGMVRFWVRDRGAGLTAEQQEDLFVPFNRLDQARTRGHGLGLSIVRRIAERLNGAVGVESTPGQGSLFYFTLPAAPPGELPGASPDA